MTSSASPTISTIRRGFAKSGLSPFSGSPDPRSRQRGSMPAVSFVAAIGFAQIRPSASSA
jgi:hypothetical protein